MITFLNKLDSCSQCGALTRNYYKCSSVVLCIDCIDKLCHVYCDCFKEFLDDDR